MGYDAPFGEPFMPRSADELFDYAYTVTTNTHINYKRATFLYYIARIMVASYEAIAQALPIQVWNEYRNSLDHLMRYTADPSETTLVHLERVESHIQRAVLDICKYLCLEMHDIIARLIERDGVECLRLVDNGAFYTKILNLTASAEEKFTKAKISDNQLGKYFTPNDEVIRRYLEPCFLYLNVQSLFRENRDKIETAAHHLLSIKVNVENNVRKEESGKLHLTGHLVGHAVWAVVALCAVIAWGKMLPLLIEKFPSLSLLGPSVPM